jgi:hypothetical protein
MRRQTIMNKGTIKTLEATINNYICRTKYDQCKYAHYKDGKTYYTDGYIAISFYGTLDNIPYKMNEDVPSFLYDYFKNLLLDMEMNLSLPDYKELVRYQRLATKHNKSSYNMYNFGNGKPAVQAKYLIDMMKIMGYNRRSDGIINRIKTPMRGVYPVYMGNKEIEIVLMPVQKIKYITDKETDLHYYDCYFPEVKK